MEKDRAKSYQLKKNQAEKEKKEQIEMRRKSIEDHIEVHKYETSNQWDS